MGFPRQEYWSELPFPSSRDLSNPGIKPVSLVSPALAGRWFTTRATWEALSLLSKMQVTWRSCWQRSSHTPSYNPRCMVLKSIVEALETYKVTPMTESFFCFPLRIPGPGTGRGLVPSSSTAQWGTAQTISRLRSHVLKVQSKSSSAQQKSQIHSQIWKSRTEKLPSAERTRSVVLRVCFFRAVASASWGIR